MYSNNTLDNSKIHELSLERAHEVINSKQCLDYQAEYLNPSEFITKDLGESNVNFIQHDGLNLELDDLEQEIKDKMFEKIKNTNVLMDDLFMENDSIKDELILLENQHIKKDETEFNKLIVISNNASRMAFFTQVTNDDITSVNDILKIFQYTCNFIELDSEIADKIKNNIKYLRYLGYINDNNTVTLDDNKYLSIDELKENILSKLDDIFKYIKTYGSILPINIKEKQPIILGLDEDKIEKDKPNFIPQPIHVSQNCTIEQAMNTYISHGIFTDDYKKIQFITTTIGKGSILILRNNITGELKIIEPNNTANSWIINFVINKNLGAILGELNISKLSLIYLNDTFNKNELMWNIMNDTYNSIGEISEEIETYIDSVSNISSIQYLKNKIKELYKLSTDVKDVIQFTDIYDAIIKDLQYHHTKDSTVENLKNIKHMLPYILSEIGLKKKRSSKGIMWYGLISKNKFYATKGKN